MRLLALLTSILITILLTAKCPLHCRVNFRPALVAVLQPGQKYEQTPDFSKVGSAIFRHAPGSVEFTR